MKLRRRPEPGRAGGARARRSLCAAAAALAIAAAPPSALAAPHGHGAAPPAPAAPPPIPTAQQQPAADANAGYADPFSSLGAKSPFCGRSVGPTAGRNCRASGSIAHPYPLSSYGIDSQVSMSITNLGDYVFGALQDTAAFLWYALVFVIKGVLLMLEWAFSLDLLNRAMTAVRHALDTLHSRVLGRPWFLAAIAVAGLWGIWRGLVQRRTAETLGGLAATVALMVLALVLISDPAGTVGHASKLADDASLEIVSAATQGDVARPEQGFAHDLGSLFDTTVLKPWAALEFGDTRWALAAAKPGSDVTNADVWLSFPAGSAQRTALYKLQKGESLDAGGLLGSIVGFLATAPLSPLQHAIKLVQVGAHVLGGGSTSVPDAFKSYVHKDPTKVRMQEAGGTFPRLALLTLIAIGLVGAILLFLYVGVRLLLAAVMSLLLLLLAPAMLLAPAFGASGRSTTVAWLKRLLGAVAAKLIYSLLLAVLLVASAAIESLALGWIATWLVLIAFWWGALLKRKELIGFVSAGHAPIDARGGGGGGRMLRAFYGLRLAGWAAAGLRDHMVGPATPPPIDRRPPGGPRQREEVDALERETAAEERELVARFKNEEVAHAHRTAAAREGLEGELADINGRLASFDARTASGPDGAAPTAEEAPLVARRREVSGELRARRFVVADAVLRDAGVSPAGNGRQPVDFAGSDSPAPQPSDERAAHDDASATVAERAAPPQRHDPVPAGPDAAATATPGAPPSDRGSSPAKAEERNPEPPAAEIDHRDHLPQKPKQSPPGVRSRRRRNVR